MKTLTKLTETKKGQLIKLNSRSDVYEVLNNGFRTELKNMYTNVISSFKPYTMRNGVMHDRKVEIVDFY